MQRTLLLHIRVAARLFVWNAILTRMTSLLLAMMGPPLNT